jgi:hypothetical protein
MMTSEIASTKNHNKSRFILLWIQGICPERHCIFEEEGGLQKGGESMTSKLPVLQCVFSISTRNKRKTQQNDASNFRVALCGHSLEAAQS